MIDFLSANYLWIKSLHIIAVISWMAGMLYLPRLFVYHAQEPAGSQTSETFKVMERKLLKYIMNPAMIVTFALGFALMVVPGIAAKPNGWLHGKLFLVLLLAGCHGVFARHVRLFAADRNVQKHTYFRVLNEIPTVLMILIVILVIVKPF